MAVDRGRAAAYSRSVVATSPASRQQCHRRGSPLAALVLAVAAAAAAVMAVTLAGGGHAGEPRCDHTALAGRPGGQLLPPMRVRGAVTPRKAGIPERDKKIIDGQRWIKQPWIPKPQRRRKTKVQGLQALAKRVMFFNNSGYATLKANKAKRQKYTVLLLKDLPLKKGKIAKAGTEIQVKPGFYRSRLLHTGIAQMPDPEVVKAMRERAIRDQMELRALKEAAEEVKEKLEAVDAYIIRKKTRDGSKRIYGSVSPSNVAEVITMETGIPTKVANITMPGKIIQLGAFNAEVGLAEDIFANVKVKVVGEAGDGDEEED